jgi:hypothetical protein
MTKSYSVLALALLACTEAPLTSDEIGQMEQSLCSNVDGVPSAMAALAVATATELKRWEPTTDFQMKDGFLALTRAGKRQCDDGRCWNTQTLLDLQRAPAGAVQLGGVDLDAESYRTELKANFRAQQRCESTHGDNCSAERHELTLESSASGACDTVFTFHATAPTGSALRDPSKLKNQLIYAGYPENEYLSFASTSSTVSIDPTYGLNDSGTTGTGSCTAACVKVSSTNIAGDCCSCNGVTHSYVRSAFSSTLYICMLRAARAARLTASVPSQWRSRP